MFLGTYEYRLDAKGRLPLPSRFRERLRPGVVLTQGVDPCILVHPAGEWEQASAQVAAPALSRERLRRRNRMLFANAFPADIDNQGRIALPTALRLYAGINDEAVVVGAGNYLEIWSREQWLSEKASIDEQARLIAESTGPQ